MDISIFDVIGPVMIGPSSSHTAGAAKLARVAAIIAEKPFHHIDFGLYGSFEKTGKGHGTYQALLGGCLGIHEDDKEICNAFEISKKRGITYFFHPVELEDCHENTAVISFYDGNGIISKVQGSSLGGGRICIMKIDDIRIDFNAELTTLLIVQEDLPGVVHDITGVLIKYNINIATMKVLRSTKGNIATTVIEVDNRISESLKKDLNKLINVNRVTIISSEEEKNVS